MVVVHMLQTATTFPFLLRISKTSLSDARESTRLCKLLTSLSVLSGLVCETPISAAFSDAPSLLIVCTPVGGSHSRSIILISLDHFHCPWTLKNLVDCLGAVEFRRPCPALEANYQFSTSLLLAPKGGGPLGCDHNSHSVLHCFRTHRSRTKSTGLAKYLFCRIPCCCNSNQQNRFPYGHS